MSRYNDFNRGGNGGGFGGGNRGGGAGVKPGFWGDNK